MSEPPAPNPDGSYTFSAEAVQEIRDVIFKLARANNDAEAIAAIDKAFDILPMPSLIEKQKREVFEANIQKQMLEYEKANLSSELSPELAKALHQRHEKETEELNKRQLSERKNAASSEIPALASRHAKEQREHEARYKADIKRYAEEEREEKRNPADIEDSSRKKGYTR